METKRQIFDLNVFSYYLLRLNSIAVLFFEDRLHNTTSASLVLSRFNNIIVLLMRELIYTRILI